MPPIVLMPPPIGSYERRKDERSGNHQKNTRSTSMIGVSPSTPETGIIDWPSTRNTCASFVACRVLGSMRLMNTPLCRTRTNLSAGAACRDGTSMRPCLNRRCPPSVHARDRRSSACRASISQRWHGAFQWCSAHALIVNRPTALPRAGRGLPSSRSRHATRSGCAQCSTALPPPRFRPIRRRLLPGGRHCDRLREREHERVRVVRTLLPARLDVCLRFDDELP